LNNHFYSIFITGVFTNLALFLWQFSEFFDVSKALVGIVYWVDSNFFAIGNWCTVQHGERVGLFSEASSVDVVNV